MGNIITFYSYKGGVGRSMALANVGVILAQWGYDVLAIDFDLEAPGPECFFQSFVDISTMRRRRGLVDCLYDYFYEQKKTVSFKTDAVSIRLPKTSGGLCLWTAGMRDEDYFKRVRYLDFPKLYADMNGGSVIEGIRNKLKKAFDFVLVDSRTGLTDIGGVCTVQLPDTVVFLFTPTEQAFDGGLDIIRRTLIARQRLPFSRPVIPTIPIPCRFDAQTEFRLSQRWLDRFARDLQDIYSDWLPKYVNRRELLELTKLPHVPFFTFGESLPVLEHGTTDPAGLGYAYVNLAALIAKTLQQVEFLIKKRDKYVSSAVRKQIVSKPPEGKAKIFISYHHADKKWADMLQVHLLPFISERDLVIWSDREIHAGSIWEENLLAAISEATVAVLLVSPDYLASEFVISEDFPKLLRAAEERGLRITWIAVEASAFVVTELASFQAAYDPNRPLAELTKSERNRAFVEIAKRISAIAGRAY